MLACLSTQARLCNDRRLGPCQSPFDSLVCVEHSRSSNREEISQRVEKCDHEI